MLLPFYAIGSALVVDRMLAGRALLRRLAVGWLVAAPLWSFYFMFTHPRAVIERDDVAKTNAYLAQHDRNDFVMSNVLSDGHIQASFERHYWAALDADDTSVAGLQMMRIYELTGTDYVHEIIFRGPDSRFIDKSLWPLAMRRRLWSVTGWPFLYRAKTNAVIRKYDQYVMENLEAVRATKVLDLSNYAVYRVDRQTVLDLMAAKIPVVTQIDFGSLTSRRHVLMGWSWPHVLPKVDTPVTSIGGFYRCPMPPTPERSNACKTILTKFGLKLKEEQHTPTGQVYVRVERSCELRIEVTLGREGEFELAMNGFTARPPKGLTATVTVPAHAVKAGMNIVELTNRSPRATADASPKDLDAQLHVASMELAPMCGS